MNSPSPQQIEEMYKELSNLKDRVNALEDRKEAASFAPQNTFVINNKEETVGARVLYRRVEVKVTGLIKEKARSNWIELAVGPQAGVDIEIVKITDKEGKALTQINDGFMWLASSGGIPSEAASPPFVVPMVHSVGGAAPNVSTFAIYALEELAINSIVQCVLMRPE